jgi:rod shape-determining protein MreD
MRGIMPNGTRQLLLPASPLFIWVSLILSFILNITLSVWFWGRASWLPDLLLVTLLFWTIHQTQRVGMGTAFFFGLIMDVQSSSLLGQHAMSYTLLSFIAIVIHRRILWFKTSTQALQLIPLFSAAHLVQNLLRYFSSAVTLDFLAIIAPLLEAMLWPFVSVILLLPQRRSPDPDATRPL